MKLIIRGVCIHVKQREENFCNAEHDAVEGGMRNMMRRRRKACRTIGASKPAAMDARWLLLLSAGTRGSGARVESWSASRAERAGL